MYQIKINDKYNFKVLAKQNQITVDGNVIEFDAIDLNQNALNVLYQNKSYNVELINLDKIEKTAAVKVNGQVYQLSIKDQFDELLKQLGMDSLAASKILQVKAPMPGLVLSVLVKEGDEIKKGDNLLVLEAMKMENMIKSPTDGMIKKIAIKQGDKVEKNALLISFN